MRDTELSWCAGLYEGEGNIHLSTQRALMVSVVNIDPELLEPFIVFGGEVLARSVPTTPNHKQSFNWRIGGNLQVKVFIEAILPYLKSSRKRSQLLLASEFIAFDWVEKTKPRHMRDHKRYDDYYQKFRELHK